MHPTNTSSVPTDEHAQLAVETFRMLADPTRLKVLWVLLQREANVTTLSQLVDATPSAISQHLAKLRLAGLVGSRREGTFVYYTAASAHVRRLLTEALSHAEHVTGEVTGTDPHTY